MPPGKLNINAPGCPRCAYNVEELKQTRERARNYREALKALRDAWGHEALCVFQEGLNRGETTEAAPACDCRFAWATAVLDAPQVRPGVPA